MKPANVLLNTAAIRKRVDELELRLWWIADQIKVSEKSVSRWLSGKIKRTSEENAANLAAILQCTLADITQDETDQYATETDFKIAMQSLQSPDFKRSIELAGNWEIYENLTRSMLNAKLPKKDLVSLYFQLVFSALHQLSPKKTAQYLTIAKNLASEIGDSVVWMRYHAYEAMYLHQSGNFEASNQAIEEAINVDGSEDSHKIEMKLFPLRASNYFFLGQGENISQILSSLPGDEDTFTREIKLEVLIADFWIHAFQDNTAQLELAYQAINNLSAADLSPTTRIDRLCHLALYEFIWNYNAFDLKAYAALQNSQMMSTYLDLFHIIDLTEANKEGEVETCSDTALNRIKHAPWHALALYIQMNLIKKAALKNKGKTLILAPYNEKIRLSSLPSPKFWKKVLDQYLNN